MVGTVRAARRRWIAQAALAGGLVLGAAAVFGALGAIGAVLEPSSVFVVAAGALAGAAVLIDLAGLRVRPQVHFQVPEPWRRTMPLSRALFLYGVLLGAGVTTLVPAAAVWALLALSVALGSAGGGLAIGLSFALGRALPLLAVRDETALAERPRGPRLLRALASVSLLIALVAGAARAATPIAAPAGDPGASDADVVWQEPGVGGFLLRDGQRTQLPGNDPAVGGPYIAWHVANVVTVAARDTLAPVLELPLPGAEKLAISAQWLAYRVALPTGTEQLRALSLADPASVRILTHARTRGVLGRPSLLDNVVLYHLTGPSGSRLFSVDLASGKRRLLRSSKATQLLNPSRIGGKLLYERISRCGQELRLGPLDGNGSGRVLYMLPPLAGQDAGHERGHTRQGERRPCPFNFKPTARMLWTTAITATTAYVTVLRPGHGGTMTPSLLAIAR
jgi:hypothetical protein